MTSPFQVIFPCFSKPVDGRRDASAAQPYIGVAV